MQRGHPRRACRRSASSGTRGVTARCCDLIPRGGFALRACESRRLTLRWRVPHTGVERGWPAASSFAASGAARRQFGVERLRSVGKETPALLLPALRMRPNVVTGVAPEVQEPLQNGGQAGFLARTRGACETTHEGMNVRGLCSAVHTGAPDRSASSRGGNRSAHSAEVNRRTICLDCDTRMRRAATAGSHHQYGPPSHVEAAATRPHFSARSREGQPAPRLALQ